MSELRIVVGIRSLAVVLATFAALAPTPAGALARSHRGTCAAAHGSRPRHAARGCTHARGRRRSGHGGRRAARTSAPNSHAAGQGQVTASCADGGAPTLAPAGEASCADGSEPSCPDGASALAAAGSAGPLCPAGEPPSSAGESTCTVTACAFDSAGPPPDRGEEACGSCEAIEA